MPTETTQRTSSTCSGLQTRAVETARLQGAPRLEAFRTDRPVVLEAITDHSVPPLPPHISLQHATQYMRAMAKGDPEAWTTLRASFHEAVDSFLPHQALR